MKALPDKVIVRRIKTKDFARLAEILKVTFQREMAVVGFDSGRLLRLRKYHLVIELLYHVFDLLHKDYPTIIVATVGDEVVGEVHLVPFGRRTWTIDSLAVDPSCSRRGLGFTLIKESVDYVAKRQACKVLSSMRTDNIAANKIARKLGYQIFEERVTLINETSRLQKSYSNDISVREAKPEDTKQIYEVAKTADPSKTQVFDIAPEDFIGSLSQTLTDRIAGIHSKRFVAEYEGEIVGYADMVYTSPKEAARIEPFYLSPSSNLSEVANSLLRKITENLASRKISKITTSVSTDHSETIETLTQLGFAPIANMYWYVCLDRKTEQQAK